MTIKARILLIISILATLCTSIAGFIFYETTEDSMKTIFVDMLKENNKSALKSVDSFVHERMADLEVNYDYFLQTLERKPLSELTKSFLKIRNTFKLYEYLAYINKNGTTLIDTRRVNLNDKNEFDTQIDKTIKEAYFNTLKDPYTGKSKLVFIKNIFNPSYEGSFLWVVSSERLNDGFSGFNEKIGENIYPNVTLMDNKGTILYKNFSVNDINSKLENHQLRANYHILQTDDYISVIQSDSDLHTNQEARWKMISSFSIEELEKPIHKIRNQIIAYSVLGLLVILALLNLYIDLLFRPLQTVLHSFDSLSNGNFKEISQKFIYKDEFSQLIYNYNLMVRKLKKSIEDATSASKFASLGEMAAGIAHEINNPLQIIRGYSCLIPRHVETKQEQKLIENSKKTINSIDRISKIINALRAYARDGAQESFRNVSLQSIIDDTLVFCGERFNNNNVDLKINGRKNEIQICCRPEQITQILLNLLNNSFDAIQDIKEKWIQIDFKIENEKLILSVLNSGPKIPDEIANKLFIPFYTTKEVGKGTGLGLSISKGIAESHHGKIYMDKNSEFTKFTLEVPLSQDYHTDAVIQSYTNDSEKIAS